MLTLSLLRHAKSDWGDASTSDFDRPLSRRGAEAAPRMGAYMARHGVKPDLVLCSTAARTRATLACIQPMLGLPDTSVEFEDELYLASHTTMLRLIKAIPGGPLHVMIVGHNPGMQSLALALTNRDGEAPLGEGLLQSIARKFPTCGLAVFQFDAPAWSVIATGTGKLIHFMAPRLLE